MTAATTKAKPSPSSKGGLTFASLVFISVLSLVLPPLLMIVFGSITDTDPGEVPHFTLDTLKAVYGASSVYGSLLNSIIYAASTCIIAITVGGGLAWLVERTDGAPRGLAQLMGVVPVLLPAVVFTSAWIMLLNPTTGPINEIMVLLGFSDKTFTAYSFGGMILIGSLQELPLAFLWLWPAFRSMNPALEDAALMSGASMFTLTRRITLPLLTPAVLAAAMICFISGFSSLSVPLMVGVPSGIILYSTEIYLAVTRIPSDMNAASALCVLFLVLTVVSLYLYRKALGDTSRYAVITGKAYAPRRLSLGKWRLLTKTLCILLFVCLAVLPTFVIAWNAFLPYPQPPTVASIALLGLGNFAAALDYGPAVRAVLNSLLLGVAAGVITTALGFLVALLQHRTPFKTLALMSDQLATAPITFPGILLGVSLLWTFLTLPIPVYGTRWILLIAYVTLFLPYAVRSSNAALTQLNKELDEAAYISGASQVTTSFRIILPLMAPTLTVSVLYVLLRAFREYSASIFLTAVGTEVFSVLVLDMWSGGNSNILAAYVIMVMGLLTLVAGGLFWVSSRTSLRT
jgi:iron(III) transport system permease protein